MRSDLNAFDFVEQPNKTKILANEKCEQIWCQANIGRERLLIGCVYRPPPTSKYFYTNTNLAVNESITKAAKLVETGIFSNFILAGDFNFHNLSSLGGTLRQQRWLSFFRHN